MQIRSSQSTSDSVSGVSSDLFEATAAASQSESGPNQPIASATSDPDFDESSVPVAAERDETHTLPSAANSPAYPATTISQNNSDSLVLSRFDQPTLFGLLLFASLGVIGWSLWQSSWLRSRTIDIDTARRSPLVFVVDLNSASAAELANLPGVGPKLAEAIIAYREEYGLFSNSADLLKVSGIGEGKLKAILPYLRPLGSILEPDSSSPPPIETR